MIKTLTTCFVVCFAFMGFAQQTNLSPRIANYDIDVQLDVEQKKIIGSEQLTWKNTSSDTIETFPLHLYLNAFKNTESSFIKGWWEVPDNFTLQLFADKGWSSVDIKSIVDAAGNDLTKSMVYIHPDDDNDKDQTVASVTLAKPILPGEILDVNIKWNTTIPKAMVRSGYNKEFFFMGQWFPKIGVYEEAGTRYSEVGNWKCHQYHTNSEFYADFGSYNVDITVPKEYSIGATGALVKETETDSLKTYSYKADDVIDFAWAASPHFVLIEEEYKGINLRYFSYPDHSHMANRYFEILKHSLSFFEEYLEKYPYPNLTIIEPPFHGLHSRGMEYPTLLALGNICLLPEGVRTAEAFAVHEFTHQYFMQILASNEAEEPWLDEGLTSYFEARIMDQVYGSESSAVDFMGIQIGKTDMARKDFVHSSKAQTAKNNAPSWKYEDDSYQVISYFKTHTWLKTLEGLVGLETMDEIIKTYYKRWKFKHPCGKDFLTIIDEVVTKKHGNEFGSQVMNFVDQALNTTYTCDFKVVDIDNAENRESPEDYKSKVIVERVGEMILPVEIQITFRDGKTVNENWDGQTRRKEFSYNGKSKVESVQIDPERKLYIDKDYINNSYTSGKEENAIFKYATKFMIWMQNSMQSILVLA